MMHTRIRTRIISTLLSAAMCLSMFPAQAFAATVEAKLQVEAETQSPIAVLGGDAETVEDASEAAEQVREPAAQPRRVSYTPEGAAYTLNFDETTGTIQGFTAQEGFDGHLVIPETIEGHEVTSIGYSAFYTNSYDHRNQLLTVDLPETVTALEESAFSNCYNLTAVTGGENISEVGKFAFNNCSKLSTVPSFEQVTSLGDRVFCYTALTSFHVPAGLTTVPDSTFDGCEALTEITFENQITAIGDSAFAGTGLTAVAVPEGVTTLGDGAFEDCEALESVTLPSTLTSMGEKAFSGCSALKAVSIPGSLSAIPEQAFFDCASLSSVTLGEGVASIGTRAFGNCTSLTSINFPATLTSLYGRAFENCGFTSIHVPATVKQYYTVDGYGYTFDNCDSLVSAVVGSPVIPTCMFTSCDALKEVELLDSVTGIGYAAFQYCYQLSNITFYNSATEIYDGTLVSARPTVHGYENSTAYDWAVENGYQFVDLNAVPTRTLSARVLTPEGETLTDGFTVNWYEAGGTTPAGTGAVLSGAAAEADYVCEVLLGGELLEQYEQPARQTVPAGTEDTAITFTLTQREQTPVVSVSGQVQDEAGNPLSGVQVTATLADGEVRTDQTGPDGSFALAELPAQSVRLQIRLDGYYSKTLVLPLADAAETGEYQVAAVTLYETVSDRIELSLTLRHAAGQGESAREESLSALGSLQISLSSGGTGIAGEDYEVQGTAVVFQPNVVTAGQEITVSISDPSGRWSGGSARTVLDGSRMGAAALELVEKGGFQLTTLSLPGTSNVLVFDYSGQFQTLYTAQTGLTSGPIEAGKYTLVFLQDTPMLQSVSSLELLNRLGLAEGTDYAAVEVTIADGVLAQVDPVTVPPLPQDAFSYLTSSGVSVSDHAPSQGTLVLVSVRFDLAEDYTAQNIQLSLPSNMDLVDGSVTVDNAVRPYTETDGILTVSTPGLTSGVLRLYLTAAQVGDAQIAPYAALSNGALQPLGTAMVEVARADMSMPEKTPEQEIVVTGTAMANSKIILYDNGKAMAETSANAAGSWSCTMSLAEPLYDYSYHFIQAEICRDGAEPVRTDENLVIFDEQAVNLTTVTMYNLNHYTGETATVLDFTKAETVEPFYYYWPDYMDYTFRVAFAGDADQLKEVTVVTRGINGETIRIPASYDAATGDWLAAYEFTQYNTPVAVGVEYDGGEGLSLEVSPEAFLGSAQQFDQAVEQAADRVETVYAGDAGSQQADGDTLLYQFREVGEDGNSLTMDLLLPGDEEQVLCRYTIAKAPDSRTGTELEADGYNFLPDDSLYVKFTIDGAQMRTEYVDVAAGSCLSEVYLLGGEQPARSRAAAARLDLDLDLELPEEIPENSWELYEMFADLVIGKLSEIPVYGEFASATQEIIQTASQQYNWRRELNGNYEILSEYLDSVEVALNAACPDGSRKLNPSLASALFQTFFALREEIAAYRENGLLMINASLGLPVLQEVITDLIHDAVSDIGFGRIDEWLEEKYGEDIAQAQEMKEKVKELLGERWQLEGAMAEVEELLDTGNFTDYVTNKVLNSFVTESEDGDVIDVHFGTWSAKFYTEQGVENYLNTGFQEYYERIQDLSIAITRNYVQCPDGGDEPEPGDDPKPNPDPKPDSDPQPGNGFHGSGSSSTGGQSIPERDLRPVYDPSGYVYEAVPSNRLEGVTATVYYQDGETETEWDAENYDQINPQLTDSSGMYAWFVPEGQWKVTFTKDGYQSADSSGVAAAVDNTEHPGWLPVPPPQFEVNVALVSTASPEVEQVIAYTDHIEVVFSQYMDIESVQEAVSVGRSGQPVAVTVTALDAEDTPDGSTQYATRFAVVPADSDISGSLTVSSAAENYAGKIISTSYSQALPKPVQRPAGIVAEDAAVVLHESAGVSVALLPAIAGQSLAVENLTPSLLNVSADSITTGENGTAVLTLTGVLPGTGLVRVTEPVSGLTEDFIVTVVATAAELPEEPDQPQPEKPATVTAALADGTPVTSGMALERGVQITLATTTEGAEIRYTLNDTCPCTEEALTYASPITLTEDTVLRAAALLDGVYSDTIRLELTVQAAEPEDPDDSDDSGSGGGGGGSSSTGGGSTTAPEDEPSQDSMPFIDVDENDWFYDAVAYAYENSLMAGTSGTTFSPDLTTTRAMIVTILYRLEDTPIVSGGSDFTDVEIGQWYSDAIAWAAANNIVGGYGNGLFGPDDPITREQLAAILYRYAQYKSYDTTASDDLSRYTDLGQLSEWAQEAVAWANSEGIISGTSAVTLAPKDSATRAQAAAMMMRFCENITP